MPRFFFTISRHEKIGEDENGIELASVKAAHRHALRLAEQLKKVGVAGAQVVVGDRDGAPLFGVPASDRAPACHVEPRGCLG